MLHSFPPSLVPFATFPKSTGRPISPETGTKSAKLHGIGQNVSEFLISESPKVPTAAAIHFQRLNEAHPVGVGEKPADVTASGGSGSQGNGEPQIRPPLGLLF